MLDVTIDVSNGGDEEDADDEDWYEFDLDDDDMDEGDADRDDDAVGDLEADDERDTYSLFKILCKVDVSRWRSLRLCTEEDIRTDPGSWKQLENLKGTFGSLKVLEIESYRAIPFHGRLYTLLMESQGTVTTLRTAVGIPKCLKNQAFLKNVNKLVKFDKEWLVGDAVSPIRPWLSSWTSQGEIQLPLPPHLVLGSISKAILHALDFSAVRFLEMTIRPSNDMEVLENVVQLPSLISLIFDDTLSDVRFLNAPQLQDLKVVRRSYSFGLGAHLWREEATRVLRLFKEEAHEITMNPKSLTIEISIAWQLLMSVIEHWDRLNHLTIDISRNKALSWNDEFAEAFIRAEQPVCLNLEVLTLKTVWPKEESDRWEKTVQIMFEQRAKAGRLQKVSWTHGLADRYTSVHFRDQSFTLSLSSVS